LLKFGLQLPIIFGLLFEAVNHLAHSTAVVITKVTGNVNAAFAAEFDARPDFQAVVGFAGEELLEPGTALFDLLGRGPAGGFAGGFMAGEGSGFVEEGLAAKDEATEEVLPRFGGGLAEDTGNAATVFGAGGLGIVVPVVEPVEAEPRGCFLAEAGVVAMAAPRVGVEVGSAFGGDRVGFANGTDGVEVDVLDEPGGVVVGFDELGFEAALKEVTDAVVMAVETNGVGDLEPADGLAEVGERGFEDEMIVVGKKTIRLQPNPKPLDHLGQSVEKQLTILVTAEYVATFIAACGHVVRGVRKLNA
jgi:hypothetical protein